MDFACDENELIPSVPLLQVCLSRNACDVAETHPRAHHCVSFDEQSKCSLYFSDVFEENNHFLIDSKLLTRIRFLFLHNILKHKIFSQIFIMYTYFFFSESIINFSTYIKENKRKTTSSFLHN